MKIQHFGKAVTLVMGLMGCVLPVSMAQTTVEIATSPVGMVNVPCPGNAETIMSLSFHRDPVFKGQTASVAGTVLTVAGSPGWTAQQFVYQAASQRETYYVLIGGGSREGMYYTVTANTANTLTLDTGGDDLSVIAADTPVQIIPFWTLGTAFPNGKGVHASTIHFFQNTVLLMFRPATLNTAGVNQLPEDIFYYYGGTGTKGWRKIGGGINTLQDDVPIVPDTYFVIRHNIPTATNVFNAGSVVDQIPALVPLLRIQPDTNQDNFIGLPLSVPMTLGQSRLVQSGAFLGSSDHFNQQDLLLIFDDSIPEKNKIPVKIYYYYTGAVGPGAGWRLIGGGINSVRDNDLVFKPGWGYVIRKRKQSTAGASFWPVQPPYLLNN
jgi:uncharacterized protein (TIGR02597 family)